MKSINLITILGPTAAGKTALAARLANEIGAEIISADSRQVFRGMDIGTGKDMDDYIINGERVAAHLIDIAEAGSEYSVFNFINDFQQAYADILVRGKQAVLCGGTGLYLQAVLSGYDLEEVPVNQAFRDSIHGLTMDALVLQLGQKRQLHNTTDTTDRERLVRALEIETFRNSGKRVEQSTGFGNGPVFGLRFERSILRERITQRLKTRLEGGMIQEVENLRKSGVPAERLMLYGLEYKYVTQFILGEISYEKMFSLLNIAIHQFAKRQMTWFRRMEKNGIEIRWLDGEAGMERNLGIIMDAICGF